MRIRTLNTKATARPMLSPSSIDIRLHRDNATHRRIIDQYRKCHRLCERCLAVGQTTPTVEIHHMQPISQGGCTQPGNLLALCFSCHAVIHDVPLAEQLTMKSASLGVASRNDGKCDADTHVDTKHAYGDSPEKC